MDGVFHQFAVEGHAVDAEDLGGAQFDAAFLVQGICDAAVIVELSTGLSALSQEAQGFGHYFDLDLPKETLRHSREHMNLSHVGDALAAAARIIVDDADRANRQGRAAA